MPRKGPSAPSTWGLSRGVSANDGHSSGRKRVGMEGWTSGEETKTSEKISREAGVVLAHEAVRDGLVGHMGLLSTP